MRYSLAIFDLDGTILNTLEDLHNSVNYALSKSHFSTRTIDETRSFVGNGALNLIKRALPDNLSNDIINTVFNDFNTNYKKHCNDKTAPYDGIIDVIKQLRQHGVKIAVVSNKPNYGVQSLCAIHFNGLLDYAVGERKGISKKPSPDSVNEVLKKLDFTANEAVYIGDSEVDIMTAKNAKMNCISVTWGFKDREFLENNNAELIVTTPADIIKYFEI